jgi:hypothetical protein
VAVIDPALYSAVALLVILTSEDEKASDGPDAMWGIDADTERSEP